MSSQAWLAAGALVFLGYSSAAVGSLLKIVGVALAILLLLEKTPLPAQ